MAIHAMVSAGVYGTFEGSPPFGTGLPSPTRTLFWDTSVGMAFPTGEIILHPVTPGVRVNATSNYIYSVIEVRQSGLNVHSVKYASNASAASLATAADA